MLLIESAVPERRGPRRTAWGAEHLGSHGRGDSFRSSITLAVTTGQLLSALPVSSATVAEPRFRLLSLRALYTILVTASLVIRICLIAKLHFWDGKLERVLVIGQLGFWSRSLAAMLCFWELSHRWGEFLEGAEATERILFSTFRARPQLRLRFTVTTVACLVVAVVEHVSHNLMVVLALHGKSTDDLLERYYSHQSQELLLISTSFHPVVFILGELQAFLAAMLCCFVDLFLILSCDALAEYLSIIHTGLLSAVEQMSAGGFWRDVRETYSAVVHAALRMDSELGYLMVLSFSGNLLLICYQLLEIKRSSQLDTPGRSVSAVYFILSVVFLTVRIAAVSLSASSIHDGGLRVKQTLFTVPLSGYSVEIDRFIFEAKARNVAMTGLKCFNITRSFILKVAGLIVTCEMVLLQLNEPSYS